MNSCRKDSSATARDLSDGDLLSLPWEKQIQNGATGWSLLVVYAGLVPSTSGDVQEGRRDVGSRGRKTCWCLRVLFVCLTGVQLWTSVLSEYI